ncbi:MAG: HD-GYP domain-containing protein [bacterium]
MDEGGGLQLGLLTLDEKADLKKGNRLINHLYTAIKAGQLYDPNNEGFSSQIDKLMDTLTTFFKTEDIVSLEVYMHCLFFNRVKIKTEFQNYIHTKFVIEVLKRRSTEGVFFRPGLTKKELSGFIRLLARRDRQEGISFEDFQEQLFAQNIVNISIHKFSAATKRSAEERLRGIRRQAKRTFFECIYNLKGIMFKGKSDQRICARRVMRLVQSIVDLIAEDESYLIGLTTMKHYDRYILNHSVNVCILSVVLGQRVGLEKDALRELGLAGLFHDLGKTCLPAEILSKGSPLNEDERALVERHPQYGVEMVMEMKSLGELPVRAMKAILEHHLRFNLSGYPDLSKREELDLFSRIVAIAEHFDVATTPQPFRPQTETADRVLIGMIERGGEEFDPILVKLFVNAVGVYPIGTLVGLDTGELAVVVQIHADPAFLDRPTVKLISDRSGAEIEGEAVDLREVNPRTGTHLRTIVKCLDPRKYGVNVFKVVAQ